MLDLCLVERVIFDTVFATCGVERLFFGQRMHDQFVAYLLDDLPQLKDVGFHANWWFAIRMNRTSRTSWQTSVICPAVGERRWWLLAQHRRNRDQSISARLTALGGRLELERRVHRVEQLPPARASVLNASGFRDTIVARSGRNAAEIGRYIRTRRRRHQWRQRRRSRIPAVTARTSPFRLELPRGPRISIPLSFSHLPPRRGKHLRRVLAVHEL